MTNRLHQLARVAEGRYFQPEERDQFLTYAGSVPSRFAAADALSEHEEAVLKATVGDLQQRYPNFAKHHHQGWAKCYRDLQLVIRQDAQALIFDDVQMLDDKTLAWLRTILAANNLTPQFCRDAFTLLRDHVKSRLGPEHYELLQPFLDRNIEVLSEFPEPATPAV
jgi:hypothetical protein